MKRHAHNPLKNGLKRRFLHPGEYRCSERPVVLSTLLGSCVAACLYDETSGVMGMNHFLLAERGQRHEPLLASDAGRYGIHAMELLIKAMIRRGARRSRLKAKVFGGANLFPAGRDAALVGSGIGETNSLFVREFLATDGIPLVSEDLGGRCARILHFTAPDFAVFVKRVPSRSVVVAAGERRLLERSLAARDRAAAASTVDVR